ncbi:hypothetical protein JCM13304A_09110 [Desulfothermus okinawensis JCM 13304]
MTIQGMDAIISANGFSITLVGMLTVFLGLFGLYVILSELHKIILIWDNRSGLFTNIFFFKKKTPFPGFDQIKNNPPLIIEQAKQLYTLSKFVGEEFSLRRVLELAKKRGLDISKDSIKVLIETEIIVQIDSDRYYWIDK